MQVEDEQEENVAVIKGLDSGTAPCSRDGHCTVLFIDVLYAFLAELPLQFFLWKNKL